jgi:hypothetical protein
MHTVVSANIAQCLYDETGWVDGSGGSDEWYEEDGVRRCPKYTLEFLAAKLEGFCDNVDGYYLFQLSYGFVRAPLWAATLREYHGERIKFERVVPADAVALLLLHMVRHGMLAAMIQSAGGNQPAEDRMAKTP